MIQLFIVLILSALVLPVRADKPTTSALLKTCSSAMFIDECKDLSEAPLDLRRDHSEVDGILFNYFLLGKPGASATISKLNSTPSKATINTALKRAEEIRQIALRLVTAGQPEAKWSPEVRAIAARISTVSFEVLDRLDRSCVERGEPGLPEAAYAAKNHAIGFCPSSLKVPSQEFAAMIAHELGHVVGPCAMSKPLFKLENFNESSTPCLTGLPDEAEPTREAFQLIDRAYTVDSDTSTTGPLLKCGLAREVDGSQLRNPKVYQTFQSCIEPLHRESYENNLIAEALKLKELPKKLSAAQKVDLDKRRRQIPAVCYRKSDEYFSDVFGGLVYAEWGSRKNITGGRFKVGLHFLTNTQCVSKITGHELMVPLLYPPSAERLSLFVRSPKAATILGCAAPLDERCSISEETFAQAAAAPSQNLNSTRP